MHWKIYIFGFVPLPDPFGIVPILHIIALGRKDISKTWKWFYNLVKGETPSLIMVYFKLRVEANCEKYSLEEILYFVINHFMITCNYVYIATIFVTINHLWEFCDYLMTMLPLCCDNWRLHPSMWRIFLVYFQPRIGY